MDDVRVGASRAGPKTCPYCRGPLLESERAWSCPRCETRHHLDCAIQNGRCTILGCEARVPPLEGLVEQPLVRRPGVLVVAGAFVLAAFVSGGLLLERSGPARLQAVEVANAPRGGETWLAPVTLEGPGGPVTLPAGGPVLVNVWLQECPDCRPAVEAWERLEARALPGLPVVNVAYQSASSEYARQHGLGERLVFDPEGERLVRPLGIGTFTTLVLDADGRVRFRGTPTDPDYLARLELVAKDLGGPTPSAPPSPPSGMRWFASTLPLEVEGKDGRLGSTRGAVAVPVEGLWWVRARDANAATMRALAELARREKVPGVSLRGTGATAASLEILSEASHLVYLDLSSTALESRDVRGVAPFPELRELLLADCAQVQGHALAGVAELKELRRLDLARTAIDDADLASLRKLPELRALSLAGTRITGHGLRHLEGMALEKLDLRGCVLVDDDAVEAIRGLRAVTSLDLGQTGVTDVGASRLAQATNLTELRLDGCPGVTDSSVRALSSLFLLRELTLPARVQEEIVAKLRRTLPKARITRGE